MEVKFNNNRLEMIPQDNFEERFATTLVRRMTDSNRLMGWYGDVTSEAGKETSGYVITWQPDQDPIKVRVEDM